MKRLVVGILGLIGLSMSANAQQQLLEKADALFKAGAYTEAIAIYRNGDFVQAIDKSQRGAIFYKIGESYRRMGQNRQAEIFYEKALDKGFDEGDFYLNYAKVLLMNESYDKALEFFGKYKASKSNSKEAEMGIQSVELAQKWKKNPTNYTVEPLAFANTRYNDFSPAVVPNDPNTLIFSSSRDAATGFSTHKTTGEKFSDIFITQLDKREKWVAPKPILGISTEVEEATCTFNEDGTTIFFSRARLAKRKQMGCEIYTAKKEGERYVDVTLIPIADDSTIVTHPTLSPDGNTLYFSSNMSGGFGGLDIWKITREGDKGSWSKPVNMGSSINSTGDEVFPYIHADGSLYFSSNGRAGMGGLDIYKARPNGGDWNVENMRYPINTSSDDFGIVFLSGKEAGYLSSRRPGGKGGDDIYMFNLPPIAINVTGTITDIKSQKPIQDAIVKLLGNDGSAVNSQTGADGSFKFMMKPNTDYIIIGTKKGYLNGKAKLNTFEVKQSKEYNAKIELTSYEKPVEVPNIFYDFNKWELNPKSTAALDLLIEMLNDNPTIIIELGSHTDSRGTMEYNYNLSQKRAQAVVDYLIEKGVPTERLRAKGYSSSTPKVVDEVMAKQYPFLKAGITLNDQTIAGLANEEQRDTAHQLNRRTEFKVISNTYMPKSK